MKLRNQRRYIRETMEEVDQYMKHTSNQSFSSSSGLDDDDIDKASKFDYTKETGKALEDDEDEDLKQWENQQILKGVNNFKHLSTNDCLNQSYLKKMNEACDSFNTYQIVNLQSYKDKLINIRSKLYNDFETANKNLKRIGREMESMEVKDLAPISSENEKSQKIEGEKMRENIYMYFQDLRRIVVTTDNYIEICEGPLKKLERILMKSVEVKSEKIQTKFQSLTKPEKLLKFGSVTNFLLEYQKINSFDVSFDEQEVKYISKELEKNQQIDLKQILNIFIRWKSEYPKIYLKCFAGACLAPIIKHYAKIESLTSQGELIPIDQSNWYLLTIRYCNYPLQDSDLSPKIKKLDSSILSYVLAELIKGHFQYFLHKASIDLLDNKSTANYSTFFKLINDIMCHSNRQEELADIMNNKLRDNILNTANLFMQNLSTNLSLNTDQDVYSFLLIDICIILLENLANLTQHLSLNNREIIIGNLIKNIFEKYFADCSSMRHMNYIEKILKIVNDKKNGQLNQVISSIKDHLRYIFKQKTKTFEGKQKNSKILDKLQNLIFKFEN
ncbi:MAG: PAX3- and PAX7-binding protein 1, variant 4 [Marteilia pararefringens]